MLYIQFLSCVIDMSMRVLNKDVDLTIASMQHSYQAQSRAFNAFKEK
jgi:hypothetical protein